MWGNGFRQLVETLPKRKCRCASQDETFRYSGIIVLVIRLLSVTPLIFHPTILLLRAHNVEHTTIHGQNLAVDV